MTYIMSCRHPMKARIRSPLGYSACRISEVDIDLLFYQTYRPKFPAGTLTTRWSVHNIMEDLICVTATKYIWVQHTTT